MNETVNAPVRQAGDREQRHALMHLALGYWRSQVLFAAMELGVFDALQDGPLDAAALAARCGSAPRHTRLLLDACGAIGLLRKAGGRYENSELARGFLATGAPHYMGNWLNFIGRSYKPWGELAQVVRSGRRAMAVKDDDAAVDPAHARSMIMAMHDYALGLGAEMLERVDFTGRRRLLDVGGGPGTYSMTLVKKYPGLSAVIYDLPGVVKIASDLIADAGLTQRVTVQPGSYITDPSLGAGYDVALLSNVLHQEDPATCRAILRKAYDALDEGGLLVVRAAFVDEQRLRPVSAVLQSLLFIVHYDGGGNYTAEAMQDMVREAGFGNLDFRRASLLSPDAVVLATKGTGPRP